MIIRANISSDPGTDFFGATDEQEIFWPFTYVIGNHRGPGTCSDHTSFCVLSVLYSPEMY